MTISVAAVWHVRDARIDREFAQLSIGHPKPFSFDPGMWKKRLFITHEKSVLSTSIE
ncbi:MAG TPA: hypothetical protein VK886_02385 [Vicinamibacterales bacterium]|nr:hypothetical protein [Vicinamibacterales bacterium]